MNDPYHTVWGDSRIDEYFKENRKMPKTHEKKKPHVYIEYYEDKIKHINSYTLLKLNGVKIDIDQVDINNDYNTHRIEVVIHQADGCVLTIPDAFLEIKRIHVRPDWDTYFLAICKAVSERADCRRAQHGCIIVKDKRIVSTGYNGSPSGGPSCLAGECPRGLLSNEQCRSLSSYENCVAIHAEANAIAYANRSDTVGATAYITGKCCDMCGKLLTAAGIRRVVWTEANSIKEILVNEVTKDGVSKAMGAV